MTNSIALVTGAAGFIGSHLCDALLEVGWVVHGVDDMSTGNRDNLDGRVTLHEIGVHDPGIGAVLARVKPEVVYHLAAQVNVRASVADPVHDARVNVLGTLGLAQAAVENGVRRILFASTGGAIYGDHEVCPTPEDVVPAPVSPYGCAKLAGEAYLGALAHIHGIEVVCLRYANVYGPRQNAHGEAGVVAIFTSAFLEGRVPTIHGEGKQTRDYVYVGDVVDANVRSLEAPAGSVYNIGTGVETSVNDLHDRLTEALGTSRRAEHGPAKAGEQARSCLDATKAREVLGWEPRTDLSTGLLRTVTWFRQQSPDAG